MFKDETCFERFALLLVSVGVFGAAAFSAGLAAEGGGIADKAASLWVRLRGQAQREAPQVVARLTLAMRAEWEQWGKTSSHADAGLREHALKSFAEVIDRLNLDPATLVGARLDAQAVADLALRRAAEVFPASYGKTDPRNAEAHLTRKFLHSITLRAYDLLLNDADFVNGIAPALWQGVLAWQNRIEEKIDALALTQREKENLLVEVATLKAKLGTTETLILTFLESIRQRAIQPDQITAELFRIAGEWRSAGERIDALSRSQTLTPELNRLREQVKEAYDAEDVARTLDLLTQIEVAEEKALHALVAHQREVADEIARRKDGLIASKTAKRDIYAAQSNVEETVRLTVEIVRSGMDGSASFFSALSNEQQRWYSRGGDAGLIFYQEVSLELSEIGLIEAKSGQDRTSAAGAKALSLLMIGQQTGQRSLIEDAERTCRTALTKIDRRRNPQQWANIQGILGMTFLAMGVVFNEITRLRKAIDACSIALTVLDKKRFPREWSSSQIGLATALAYLSARESGSGKLMQAEKAFRAALSVISKETSLRDWSLAQAGLSDVLVDLGKRQKSRAILMQAILIQRDLLEFFEAKEMPVMWAATQVSRGVTLLEIGELENDVSKFHDSAQAIRAALGVYSHERTPIAWASANNNLGSVLQNIGQLEEKIEVLSEAIVCYGFALTEYTPEKTPADWAMSFGNQGDAKRLLAQLTKDQKLAQAGLQQLAQAEATLRRQGHAQFADYCASRIPIAQALIDRLSAAP